MRAGKTSNGLCCGWRIYVTLVLDRPGIDGFSVQFVLQQLEERTQHLTMCLFNQVPMGDYTRWGLWEPTISYVLIYGNSIPRPGSSGGKFVTGWSAAYQNQALPVRHYSQSYNKPLIGQNCSVKMAGN